MRVAFLTTYNQACGIATYASEIVRSLWYLKEESSIDLTLQVWGESSPTLEGTESELVTYTWNRRFGFSETLDKLRQSPPDILHIQYQDGLFMAVNLPEVLICCRDLGIRTCLTFHSADHYLREGADLINLSSHAFVLLEQARFRYIAAGADPRKVEVIQHGYRTEPHLLVSKTEARRILELPLETSVVASFGFLESRKGVIEIIHELPRWNFYRPTVFIHEGGPHPNDNDSAHYYAECVLAAGIKRCQNETFLLDSFVDEETASIILQAADIIIMNYTHQKVEASGAAAYALRHNRPVVTSSCPSFQPLVHCTLQTSKELPLFDAVLMTLQSQTLRSEICRSARNFITTNSFTEIAKKHYQTYQQLCAQ
jgi:hypothetical protein